METTDRQARLTDLNLHDVRMLVFGENQITVHLKSGAIVEEKFPNSKAMSEALSFWARKGELFTDSQGPSIESAAGSSSPPSQ